MQVQSTGPFQALENYRNLPTKEQAERTFWMLESRFWMQIIDGKYHKFGPMVFDENLHGSAKEPGFFDSLKAGCSFASAHLTERPTLDFYKNLHKTLCAHFKGRENSTNMTAAEAGICNGCRNCRVSIKVMYEEGYHHYGIVDAYFTFSGNKETMREYMTEERCEKILSGYPESKKWVDEKEAYWQQKVREVDAYITAASRRLNIATLARISKTEHLIYVDYQIGTLEERERIIEVLFDNYNKQMDAINARLTSDEEVRAMKIEAIADLYQCLEWLHPFPDGQGRTDLVLMAKLLTEQGLHPAILKDPYFSSWSTLDEWKQELDSGLKAWELANSSHIA